MSWVSRFVQDVPHEETDSSVRTGRLGKWAVSVGLVIWGVLLIVVCATLLAGHFYTLPVPATDSPLLSAGIGEILSSTRRADWVAVHVLYAECSCSNRIVEHLLDSERPAGVHEKLLVVDPQPDWEHRARRAGFEYATTTREHLKQRYGIEAAPLMVVVRPDGVVAYAGGYTDRKQGLAIRDREILTELKAQREYPMIPLYGCAVSRTLQEAFDPLGLKYR